VSPYSTTGAFSLRVTTEQDAGTLTATGAATVVSLSKPAVTATLSFSATAGQPMSLAFAGWTFPAATTLWVQVIDPQGTVVDRVTQFGSLGSRWFTPAVSGTFRLVFSPNDSTSTGSVSITLSTEQAGGALTVGATTAVSAPRPGQTTRFSVAGTAGQRLSLDFGSYSFAHVVQVMVIKPDNTVLRDGNIDATQVDLDPLPLAGTYQIVVYPYAETGSAQLTLVQRIDAGATTVDGATTTLTMGQRGQYGETSFTATAGQRLSFGFTGWTFPSGTTVRVRMLTAAGTAIFDGVVSNGGSGDVTAPAAGTYRLIVGPSGFATGSVTFTLSQQLDAGSVALNTAKTVTFGRAGQSARMLYAGTAGQNLALNFTAGTVPYYPFVRVTNPDGTILMTNPGGAATVSIPTLPVTGSYEIMLSPFSNTGSITFTLGTRTAAAMQPFAAPFQASTAAPRTTPPPTAGAVLPAQKPDPLPKVPSGVRPDFQRPMTAADAGTDTWTPDQSNLSGKDWNTHRGAVAGSAPAPRRAPAGVTAVSGRVQTIDGKGLPGVTVTVEGAHATSDRDGQFLLAGVGGGHRVLRVDGASAGTPAKKFGLFDIGVDLAAGVTTVLPYPIWMTTLDTAHTVEFASPTDREVVITNPAIPGLEVHLPAGAVVRDVNGKPVTGLGITAIPVDRPPFPLPNSHVPVDFTVQPGSAYVFPTGARVVYPNYTHAVAGTVMDFWHYDPAGRGWFVYGHGKVTADRTQVVPDPGTEVYQFTGAMLIEPGTAPPPANASTPGGVQSAADPVDLATGLLTGTHTDLAIADTLPISVTRSYQQSDTAERTFGVGSNFDYNMYLYAQQQWVDGQLILPDGGRVRYHRITPGGTGPYDYLTAVFAADPTPTQFSGSIMAWNGNGFDVRLRDGTTYVFGEEAPLQAIRDKFGNTITITRAPAAPDVDGTVRAKGPITQVTSPNGKWLNFTYKTNNEVASVTDNLGRTVSYQYDTAGHLTQFVDAGTNPTIYTYDSAGRLATTKDGRGTVYSTNGYDAAGRVATQTNADGTTYGIAYTTDTSGKVTETRLTDPRGNVRRLTFNQAGFSTGDTHGFGTPSAQTISIVRDPSSNLVTSTTDALNRRTDLGYDAFGNITSVTQLAGTTNARSEQFAYAGPCDQMSRSTDWLGQATTYGYGANGAVHTVTDPMSAGDHCGHGGDGAGHQGHRQSGSRDRVWVCAG
jgi:YD repeat-containing protein